MNKETFMSTQYIGQQCGVVDRQMLWFDPQWVAHFCSLVSNKIILLNSNPVYIILFMQVYENNY